MVPRLLLKNKKLDKFDTLDKNMSLISLSHCDEKALIKSYLNTTIQQSSKFSQLFETLVFEQFCGQKLHFELQINQNIVTKNILRNFKLSTLTDLLLNSLLLSEDYKVARNNLSYSISLFRTSCITDFLITYKSQNFTLFVNGNQPVWTIQMTNKWFKIK